ncbi:MAG: hypothetical protein U0326_06435 [Polyangiales bacterium]
MPLFPSSYYGSHDDPEPTARSVLEYDHPSPELRALLASGGMLAPLFEPRTVVGLRLSVRVTGNAIEAHCGFACILAAWLVDGELRVVAAEYFRHQSCATDLFKRWRLNDPAFAATLNRYLDGVAFDIVPTPASLQFDLATALYEDGVARSATLDLLVLCDLPTDAASEELLIEVDHVAELGVPLEETRVPSKEEERAVWIGPSAPWIPLGDPPTLRHATPELRGEARNAPQFATAHREIESVRSSKRWRSTKERTKSPAVDHLAIDKEGRLVLLLLKGGEQTESSICYAPLELLQHVHEWRVAFAAMRQDLDRLRLARVGVGTSDTRVPELSGIFRPVVGFSRSPAPPELRAWLNTVLPIVNRHLPAEVVPIELWTLRDGVPIPLG